MAGVDFDSAEARARLKRRYRSEARFKALGLLAVLVTAAFLAFLLVDILRKGIPSFFEHRATLEINFDPAVVDPKGTRDVADLRAADYQALVRAALQAQFPEATDRRSRRALDSMISSGAVDDLRMAVLADPGLIGQKRVMPLLLSSDADLFLRQRDTLINRVRGSAR